MSLLQIPWSVNVENAYDADARQLELIDLMQSNESSYDVFQEDSLFKFYSRLEQKKYPVLLNNARIWICQFASP